MKALTLIRLSLLALFLSATFAQAEKQPNIIFIMTDDQGYGDLACHGHPFLKTPNLDELYTQSTRFTDYHVSPTCAPTRAGLMSGRNPFEAGVTHTILERERMALGLPTVAETLQSAGYATGIFGKWHLGEADEYQPGSRGFDEVFIHGAGGIGQRYDGSQGDVPGNDYFDPTIRHNGKFVKTKGFCTDVFFQEALGWIRDQKDKPFFAYIPTNAPHGPFIVGEEYKAMYRDQVDDEDTAAFFGMITNIDDNVGLLMEKLDEWGLAENTLLIYTTDNGSAKGSKIFNAGMKGGKGSQNEGGSHVPLFFRLPGTTTAGQDLDQLARHIDIFPTFAELAGADISDLGLEGRSLVPLLKDAEAEWPDRNLFFHGGRWPKEGASGKFGKGDSNPDSYQYKKFAVRSDKWRLVGINELYDIENDPGETTNVFDQHPEVVAELMAAYDEFWAKARPLLVNEDAPLDVEKPFEANYLKEKAEGGIPEWEAPEL
ncbi:MAG: arylsulfatase [Verrucomicrobiales bacterium]|jgi:arylsulfatase A-like enzyme|nr:arylsulfatase [Verrucomicrobiales bacterium]